jgi:DnaJ-domain-containing protein 1
MHDATQRGDVMCCCAAVLRAGAADVVCARTLTVLSRALVQRRLTRDLSGAKEDASDALDISPTYAKAAFRHALALFEAERYAQALAAFVHLKRLDGDFPNLVSWMQRCHVRIELAREKEPNLYTLLDAPCDASPDTLKHAYRRQSKRLHPDRAAAGGGDAHGAAHAASTGAFQALQKAWEVLRDPAKRRES